MKPCIVSEARPLKTLTPLSLQYIEHANRWLKLVRDEVAARAARNAKAYDPEMLDRERTGRVLVIDGRRGTGKTTLLLTLLDLWTNRATDGLPMVGETGASVTWAYKPETHCVVPPLDFDPLPRGTPVHGWLLAPWRAIAKESNASCDEDLTEQWHRLFDRAVNGWSAVSVEGKPLVEKSIAFDEQIEGWHTARKQWADFVNRLCCERTRGCSCPDDGSRMAHPYLFVIPIDDVDLQVEQVAGLLNAIRLFHHPNVVYVLTADSKHIEFSTTLDNLKRHLGPLREVPARKLRKWKVVDEVPDWSRELATSFLEKAIPEHARVRVRSASLNDVMVLLNDDKHKDLKLALDSALDESFVRSLPFATWRQAYHAVERHDVSSSPGAFLLDLCGVGEDKFARLPEEKLSCADLGGQLSTAPGRTLRRHGYDTQVVLTARPKLEFFPEFQRRRAGSRAAACAAILCRASTFAKAGSEVIRTPSLDWVPGDVVITTHTSVGVQGHSSVALGWPWIRPTIDQLESLGAFALRLAGKWSAAVSHISDLTFQFIVLPWMVEVFSLLPDAPKLVAETDADGFVEAVKVYRDKAEQAPREHLRDWLREMWLVTRPYFGLHFEARRALVALLKQLEPLTHDPTRTRVRLEEWRYLSTAIIRVVDDDVERVEHLDAAVDAAVKRFLRTWRDRREEDEEHSESTLGSDALWEPYYPLEEHSKDETSPGPSPK